MTPISGLITLSCTLFGIWTSCETITADCAWRRIALSCQVCMVDARLPFLHDDAAPEFALGSSAPLLNSPQQHNLHFSLSLYFSLHAPLLIIDTSQVIEYGASDTRVTDKVWLYDDCPIVQSPLHWRPQSLHKEEMKLIKGPQPDYESQNMAIHLFSSYIDATSIRLVHQLQSQCTRLEARSVERHGIV